MFGKLENQKLLKVAEKIKTRFVSGNFLDNRQITEICKENFVNLINAKSAMPRIHDILETAVNLYLFEKYAPSINENIYERLSLIESLAQNLPTQSWRDTEQKIYRQFLPPPELAYVMTQFSRHLKIRSRSSHPAGTGTLANWLKIARCRVEVNEIPQRRQVLLKIQGFKPYSHNAEFINDLLEPELNDSAL